MYERVSLIRSNPERVATALLTSLAAVAALHPNWCWNA
jgi:hypothetical protein